MRLLPKDIFVMYFAASKTLAEFVAYSKGEPYILKEIINTLERHGVEPLSCNVSRIGEYCTILIFADFANTKVSPKEVEKSLKKIKGIERVECVSESVHGLMFDELSFPITTNMGKTRAMVLLVDTLSNALKRIKSEWGTGAEAFLYYLGYDLGYESARIFRQEIAYYREEVLEVLKVIQALGWGRIEDLFIEFEAKRGSLKVYDLFESKTSIGEFATTKCHFFRGFLAGFLSQLLETNIKVFEVKCIAKGDPYCEFVFESSST